MNARDLAINSRLVNADTVTESTLPPEEVRRLFDSIFSRKANEFKYLDTYLNVYSIKLSEWPDICKLLDDNADRLIAYWDSANAGSNQQDISYIDAIKQIAAFIVKGYRPDWLVKYISDHKTDVIAALLRDMKQQGPTAYVSIAYILPKLKKLKLGWPELDVIAKSIKAQKKPQLEHADLQLGENFADGKGPGRPGDSQRHGIPKHATMAQLEKAARAPGRKGQLARWQINMRRGQRKIKESDSIDLRSMLADVRDEMERIDSASMAIQNSSQYLALEKDYRALFAIENVIKNNIIAQKNDRLDLNIFMYDYAGDPSEIAAIHVELIGSVAHVKWLGSYNSFGGQLFKRAMQAAKSRGANTVEVEAKWNSEGFYRKMGLDQGETGKPNPFTDSALTRFSGDLEETIAPHGTPENELKMMKAGTKPAVLLWRRQFDVLYRHLIDMMGWEVVSFMVDGVPHYVVAQPGERARAERIAKLVSDANKSWRKVGPEYHRELGTLLGYSSADIDHFLDKIAGRLQESEQSNQEFANRVDQGLKGHDTDIDGELSEIAYRVFREGLKLTPELGAVLDANRSAIVRLLLTKMKKLSTDDLDYYLSPLLTAFRRLGVDWPELATMHASLERDRTDEADDFNQKTEKTRQMQFYIDNILKTLNQDELDAIDYDEVMYWLRCIRYNPMQPKRFGTKIFDDNKHGLVRALLSTLKNQDEYPGDDYILDTVDGARKLGIDWPELALIERSLRGIDTAQELQLPTVDDLDSITEVKNQASAELSETDDPDPHGRMLKTIENDLEYDLSDPYNAEIVLHDIYDIGYYGIKYAPGHALHNKLEQNKTNIMKALLTAINTASFPGRWETALNGLKNMSIRWPELQIVRKSLAAVGKEKSRHRDEDR